MAQNKDFKIKNGLQVGGATSLSDSLSVTGNLTISGSGTITIGGDTFNKVLDSDLTTSLIDSDYVQLRQDKAYSSLTGTPSIPTFGVDFVDSSTVIDIINSEGLDSDLVKNLVDSAYVQLRDRFGDGDSSLVNNIINATVTSAYVKARETLDSARAIDLIKARGPGGDTVDVYLDSYYTTALIDSAYVQARQAAGGGTDPIFKNIAVAGQNTIVADTTTDTLTVAGGNNITVTTNDGTDTLTITASVPTFGNDFIDSAAAVILIDANALDSGRATRLVDSNYIQHRTQIGISDINFGSNKILYANVYDSPDLFPSASTYHGMFAHAHNTGAGYFAHGGVWIRLANYDQLPTVPTFGNDFIDSSTALTLIDANALDSARALNLIPKFGTDFIDSSTALTLIDANALDSARALDLIPKFGIDFIDSATAVVLIDANALDSGRGTSLITATVDAAYVQARQTTYTIPTLGGDFVDSAQSLILIDANALDSGRATRLIDSDYVQARVTAGTDSAATQAMIDSSISFQVNSAYVQARQDKTYASLTGAPTIPAFGTDFIDSATAQTLIDANALDSARATSLIDSDYIRIRQLSPGIVNTHGTVSLANDVTAVEVRSLIGAASSAAAGGLDSARILTFVDSAYVTNRIPQVGAQLPFRTRQYQYFSSPGQKIYTGQDMLANLALSYQALRFNVFFNGLLLADSDFATDSDGSGNQTIVLTDSADSGDIVTIVTYEAASGIDSAEAIKLNPKFGIDYIDSSTVIDIINSEGLDSDLVKALVDSAYVQLRDRFGDGDSSLVNNIISATVNGSYVQARQTLYTNADFLDSTTVSGVVDAAYVQARQTTYTIPTFGNDFIDSSAALTLIDANALDSARALDLIPKFGTDFIDSTAALTLIDANALDSARATSLIDAAYVQARQTTYTIPTFGNDFIDSTAALTLIDANALDSARAIDLVDSAYIQHRTQIGISNIDFGPTRIEFGSGANVSFIERHTSGYFNFKHNDSNQIRLGDTTGVIVKGPKIKLQMPGTDGTVLEAHDSGISVFNPNGTYGKLNRHTIPQGAGTLALTSDISSTLTLGNDFIDSDQAKILIDANALDSGRATSLINAAYVQARQTTYTNADFLDSTTVLGMIDSAYIQQRRPAESRFEVVNSGSSAYTFNGDGFSSGRNNPDIHLHRGKTYRFEVNASGHPFQIRVSSGGSAYNTGVTNNGVQVGTLVFTPDMNAPHKLVYQCTAHSGMVGNIYINDDTSFIDSGRVSSIITADVDAAFVAALGTSAIPNLPTSKITSGTFDSARIPVLSASDIITGSFDSARIPVLSASDVITGTFDSARIPTLSGSDITAGTIDSDRLPIGVFGGGGGGGSGISGITVQEEGSSLSTLATALNFVGSAVTATGSGATKTITISGGGGSGTLDSDLTTALIDSAYVQARQAAGAGFTVQDEGSSLSTLATTINFTGAGVDATGSGATKTINITGGNTGTFQSDRITITEFTADSGQTTFSGLNYTVGKTQVFLNGIQLVNTSDYTATNGSSIVLGSGADSGNTVTVISHKLQDQMFTAATNITNYFYTNTLVADSSVTSFGGADDAGNTLAYTPGKLQVYLNGIFLKDSDDYTASNGTNVVLTQAADSDDVISIVAYITENTTGGATRIDNFYYTADSGQTAFTGADDDGNTLSYVADRLQVYLNGILLRDSADYTATNGSTITLIEGTDSADILTVSAFTTKATSTFDSAGVIGFIDSAYVAARVTVPTFGVDFIDSSAALTLIDANALDSGRATPLITTLIDANALDSGRGTALITATVDAAYINARVSAGLDSDLIIALIDSDYVQARQSAGWSGQGENYGYVTAGQNPSGIPQGANIIEKYSFTSDGNATDVGDLTTTTRSTSGMSSSTHGYTSIGFPQSSDDINKFAFASDGDATNIEASFSRTYLGAGHSSEINGYASGGTSPIGPNTNEIKKFPFSAEATSNDVGDLTVGRSETTGTESSNHGYHVGGNGPSNVIDKFTFASDGNATDVGDLTEGRTGAAASASTTHGYASCGDNSSIPARARNTVDKFAFASDGSATDVGDAYHARSFLGGGASSTSSGYAAGGRGSTSNLGNNTSISSYLDTIDKVSFASDGNGTDVGNLTVGRREVAGQQY